MLKANETHLKIISLLEKEGPSLPIQIAKQLEMNSLFISAFLSELTDEKRIKVSHLKVGGSPLYFLNGQEEQLEKFHKYLHSKEAETFLILKEKRLLKDSEQEPATRVALRSIRDFAIGFKRDDEIYWKYFLILESEVEMRLNPKKEIVKQSAQSPLRISTPKIETQSQEQENRFQNPLIIQTKKTTKQKSEFTLKVIELLNNNFKIIREEDYKPKEYNCITQINSQLGLIDFFTQAKDKKTISETDLKKLLSTAQSIPLPALLIYTNEISKKAKKYAEDYASILKFKKMN